jgi:hypothetical protein
MTSRNITNEDTPDERRGDLEREYLWTPSYGRAMAQAVSRRPLTAEARVRSRFSPIGICDGQSGTGTGFPQVLRFSPVSFIPPVLHYKVKRKKTIVFITGLHNKPQVCGALHKRNCHMKDLFLIFLHIYICIYIYTKWRSFFRRLKSDTGLRSVVIIGQQSHCVYWRASCTKHRPTKV